MSNEIFRKDHIRDLLQASKNNTNARFVTFNDNMIDMFQQVNNVLANFNTRITAIENLLNPLRLYIDSDGNLAQSDEIEKEEDL